jgi:hypothetical protein
MCLISIKLLSEILLILRRIPPCHINVHKPSCKILLILVILLTDLQFSRQLFKKSPTITTSIRKIRPLGAKLFQADRHKVLSICLSQFCESASNMEHSLHTQNRRFSAILKVFEITKHKAERETELLFCVYPTFPSLLFQTYAWSRQAPQLRSTSLVCVLIIK